MPVRLANRYRLSAAPRLCRWPLPKRGRTFRKRKSAQRRHELHVVHTERARGGSSASPSGCHRQKILGLAERPKISAPLTLSHSICSFAGTKQENGGVDGTRTLLT